MKKFKILIFLLLLISCKKETVTTSQENIEQQISLLSFNIQIFGTSKMSKPEVVNILSDIVKKYDLIAIQEVRDSSGTAVPEFMKLLPEKYSYVLGPREGRSSSKEQYWYVYDKTKIEVLGYTSYPDLTDVFERNPMGVHFKIREGIFDFVLINKHVAPGDALREITYTPNIITYFSDFFKESDIIIVGDFNADGTYFKEDLLIEIFPESDYLIVINNSLNTTVAVSENTYDRIIITDDTFEDFTSQYGVYLFEEYYDFTTLGIEPKHVSDHYPVWAKFYINRDTN